MTNIPTSNASQPPTPPDAKSGNKALLGCLVLGAIMMFGFFVLTLIVGVIGLQAAKESVARADKLWDEGKKVEAVAEYKGAMETWLALDKARVPEIVSRVVEFDLENGNETGARKTIELALKNNTTIQFQSDAAKRLLAQVQAERKTLSHDSYPKGPPNIEAAKSVSRGIGISYEQLIKGFAGKFSMQRVEPQDGMETWRGGHSANKVAYLQAQGDHANLFAVNLMVGLPNDAPEVVRHSTELAIQFLRLSVPEWDGANNWLGDVLNMAPHLPENERIFRVEQGGKLIMLSAKQRGIIVLRVQKNE